MGKKRKRGPLPRLPVRHVREGQTGRLRGLSEVLKEMGLRLLKEPNAAASVPALEAAMLLASAAWNSAQGEHRLRDQHKEMLEKFEWSSRQPWPELVSADTDRLIAGLVEYKQACYQDDRRRIVAVETSANGNIRVHWIDGEEPVVATPVTNTSNPDDTVARSGQRIATEVVASVKRVVGGKVTSLESAAAGRAAAEELQRTVVTKEGLAGLHPAHAAYVYAQNQVSVLWEQLIALEEMVPFADLVSKAADFYLPSGPPMSPLTTSYFTCWAFFDARVEPTQETIGSIILEVGAASGMHPELLRLIRLMQESRMGIYAHEGADGDTIVLRDLATAATCHAVVPSGYRGQRSELWYARVLPPPIPGGSAHVAFTTPYVLTRPGLNEWQAYLRRTLPDAPDQSRIDAYARHMKYGPTGTYWNDFVFEGYVNHRTEAIFLAGLPDVPESRPHSPVNSQRSRR